MLLSLVPRAPIMAASPLRIGEVAWAGSSLSTVDEWLELWNQSDAPLSLAGYLLVGASPAPLFLPADAMIPAYGTYLIANYPDTDPKSVLAIPPQLVTSTVSLSNSILFIQLIDPDGAEIDHAGDGKLPPAGSNTAVKASMVRQGESWITATSSKSLDTPATDFGTPGICDGCTPVAPPVIEPLPQIPLPISSPNDTQSASSTEAIISPLVEAPPLIQVSSTNEIPPAIEVSSSSSMIEAEPESTTSSPDTSITNPQISDPSMPASEDTTTSTEISAEIAVVEENPTSPVEKLEIPEADTATTTITTSTEILNIDEQLATSTASTSSTIQLATVIDDPSLLRLNEIMAYPETGHEWIEITAATMTSSIHIHDLELHDAAGKIAVVPEVTLDQSHRFIVVELTSSRLNNDGDTITLQTANGIVIDSLVYDVTSKGKTFSRIPDGIGAWKETSEVTRGSSNIYTDPSTQSIPTANATPQSITIINPSSSATVSTVSASPVVAALSPTKKSTTTSKTIPKPSTKISTPPVTPKKVTLPLSMPTESVASSTFVHPTSTKVSKPPKKVTASKKKISARSPMKPTTQSSDIHVVLHGTVGSPPGLISTHAFVLLSSDGKGLEVRVPATHALPTLKTAVDVRGTLNFSNDNIPYLKADSNSPWTTSVSSTIISSPRFIDLIAPLGEDAWSLTSVTGSVASIRSGTVILKTSTSGEELSIAIKPAVHYRASRLAIGDTIEVMGLLDMTGAEPRLLPRQAEDIVLVRHAEKKLQTDTPKTMPGWTPFGAAGIAVAGTEGLKKLRERQKIRALQKMLQQPSVHEL